MRTRQLVKFNVTAEDLGVLFGPSNEVTLRTWEKRWLDNLVENLNAFPTLRSASDLVGLINRHISMVCGAGWTLRKLKQHADKVPPHWGIVVADHALLPVLEAGLKPTIVCTMDGHQEAEPHILDGFHLLNKLYPETPVLVDLVCCPSITELLKNPFWFRSAGESAHIVNRVVRRECPDLAQIGHGGNVGSVCTILAKYFCFSRHVVFMGMNFSMFPGTKNVDYWHRRVMPDEHKYLPVCDTYGRPTHTMANLHNYKWWLEHFCYTNDSVEWIIANDGGFLGVANSAANYDHYTYLTLDKAIAYLNETHSPEDLEDY